MKVATVLPQDVCFIFSGHFFPKILGILGTQSEKIVSVKSSLGEVRLNHQSEYSLIDISH